MRLKQQSSTELIVTYGTVILIIAIVVGLMYVFIGLPKQTVPNTCSIYGGLNCLDVAYNGNSMGSTLTVFASDTQPGSMNIGGFNAVVGGITATGSCNKSVIYTGQVVRCTANFPTASTPGDRCSGTLHFGTNYCPNILNANSPQTCPPGNSYVFTGTFGTQCSASTQLTTATTSISTTSISSTSSSTTSSISTSTTSTSSTSSTSSTTTTTIPLSIQVQPGLSGNVLDLGQSLTISASISNGKSPFNYNFIIANALTYNVVASHIYTSVIATTETFTYTPSSVGIFVANVIVSDATPTTKNSIYSNTIIVYPTPTANQLTPRNSVVIQGQTEVYNVLITGGSGAFNIQLVASNGVAVSSLFPSFGGRVIFGSIIPPLLGPNTYNVVATDNGVSTPFAFNSISNTIIVTQVPLSPPIQPTLIGNLFDIGQTVTFSTSVTNGNPPYTYNFLIANSISYAIIASQLYKGVPSTFNTFTYTTNRIGTFIANVIVTDNSIIPTTQNSTYSNAIIVYPTPTATLLTPRNSVVIQGQPEVYNVLISGGSGAFNFNLLLVASNGTIVNSTLNSPPGRITFNSITPLTLGPNTYNVIATDNGVTTPFIFNSISNTITVVVFPLSNPDPPILSGTSFDLGQQVSIIASVTFGLGTPPFTYHFIVANSISHAIVASQIYTGIKSRSMTFIYTTNQIGSFVSNVIVTDNALIPLTKNSIYSANFIVNPIPTATALTPSLPIDPLGQPEVFNVLVTGGTGPFNLRLTSGGYDWAFMQAASPGIATFPLIYLNDLGSTTFNVIATDTGVAPILTFTSASNTVIKIPSTTSTTSTSTATTTSTSSTSTSTSTTSTIPLGKPSAPTVIPLELDLGQSATFTTLVQSGVAPYTYNFVVINQKPGTFRFASGPISTNSFIYLSPNQGGQLAVNVIVQDSTSAIQASDYSSLFDIAPDPTAILIPSCTLLIQGNPEVFNVVVNGGIGPYMVNLLASNGMVLNAITIPAAWDPYGGPAYTHTGTIQIMPPLGMSSYSVNGVDNGVPPTILFTSAPNAIYTGTVSNSLPYVPITFTNSQATASRANFQQMVTFNALNYHSYEASDLGNIRFYQGITELYSWCESGCTSSSPNSVFWVKLSSPIPASSNGEADLMFLPSSTEYDGVYAGEAPQLSFTYARYDNGANVFDFYDNFAGTQLNPNWAVTGIVYTVNNKFIVRSAPAGYNFVENTNFNANYAANVIDYYGSSYAYQAGGPQTETGLLDKNPTYARADVGITIMTWTSIDNWYAQQYDRNGAHPYTLIGSIPQSLGNQVFTIEPISSSTASYFINYSNGVQTSLPTQQAYPLGLGLIFSPHGTGFVFPNPITYYWYRARAYPPNAVMPPESLGSVQTTRYQ